MDVAVVIDSIQIQDSSCGKRTGQESCNYFKYCTSHWVACYPWSTMIHAKNLNLMDALGIFLKFVCCRGTLSCCTHFPYQENQMLSLGLNICWPISMIFWMIFIVCCCLYVCISHTLVCTHSRHSHDFGQIWIHPSFSIDWRQKTNPPTAELTCSCSSRAAMHCTLSVHVWRFVSCFCFVTHKQMYSEDCSNRNRTKRNTFNTCA